MPRVKKTPPEPSREKGQRSLDLPVYINRIIPAFSQPEWLNAKKWRAIVANQPFATVFRDTLISNVLALDWKVEPRDSTQRDEYKSDIEYYTRFFEKPSGDYDYSDIIEWVGTDLLDLPFGGACEVGREYDQPSGKVLWIEPLDGGTLFPTLNSQIPVGQKIPDYPSDQVYFPKHAIDRIYLSPRTDIQRKGWGMPPPEKIYLAIEMLRRGDIYYAKLMLDSPEAGILDLLDMSKDSANAWLEGWKGLLEGIDPFKIPVLYEHEQSAKWIPFTRSAGDIMYDKAMLKYAGIVGAGYGMSPSDVGFSPVSSGGETLAGSIRQERRSRKSGVNRIKKKFVTFYNNLLPEYLEFKYIDLDDELSVAVGRSRLANSTALQILIDRGVLTPDEGRQQMMADGLITISIPEKIEGGDQVRQPSQNTQERPGLLGRPVTPSQGGYGEIKSDILSLDSETLGDLSEYIHIPLFQQDSDIVEGEVTMSNNGEVGFLQALMMIGKAIMDFQKRPINIFIPKSEIPVNVHLPQQTVPTPIVHVSMPENKIEPPVVNVNVPKQDPPVVNIKSRRKSVSRQKVKRDQEGNLLETVTETDHMYDED